MEREFGLVGIERLIMEIKGSIHKDRKVLLERFNELPLESKIQCTLLELSKDYFCSLKNNENAIRDFYYIQCEYGFLQHLRCNNEIYQYQTILDIDYFKPGNFTISFSLKFIKNGLMNDLNFKQNFKFHMYDVLTVQERINKITEDIYKQLDELIKK